MSEALDTELNPDPDVHRARLQQFTRSSADTGVPSAEPTPNNPARRKKQLQLIRDLLTNPPILDLAREPVVCASTPEELRDRRRELEYRLQWLRALTEMTESELALLHQARPASVTEANAALSTSAPTSSEQQPNQAKVGS